MKLTKKVDTTPQHEKPKKSNAGGTRPIPKVQQPQMVIDLLNMFDTWHAHKEIWDDDLDSQIHLNEYQVRTTHKPRLEWGKRGTKYFSPSSSNSDARELFMKLSKAKRDEQEVQPHQGRWRRLGTLFGDMLQRDMLFIDKHYKKEIGRAPEFRPFYTTIKDKSFPMWEKFAQRIVWVEHRGHSIPILGQPDGIMKHTSSGSTVGLEIKSKQTTPAQTSLFSMRDELGGKGAKMDHVKQCINYSIMYQDENGEPIEDFIIVYGNLAKKSWNMTKEEYAKNPDVRGFHVKVTEQDRLELLDYYADILDAIDTGYPPKLDPEKWTFNNFKTACALSLSAIEVEEIEGTVERVKRSSMPEWKKKGFIECIDFVKEVRANAKEED